GLTSIWKQEVYPVLETFTDRTPGSFIEEKSFSLVWHYRKVERGLGELRATELMNNLRYLIADKGLQLMPGNKVIEIKNIEVNKGKAALTFFEEQDYDFIMAMGDDHTDEDSFKVLPEKAVSMTTGRATSAANCCRPTCRRVRALLHSPIATDAARLETTGAATLHCNTGSSIQQTYTTGRLWEIARPASRLFFDSFAAQQQ